MLKGKTVLIGITAGIAAYKICELIRMYKREGANVRVILTPNALNFVTKLTLENLSQNEVFVDDFEVNDYKPEHISLCDEADIMVIAPATANTISKTLAPTHTPNTIKEIKVNGEVSVNDNNIFAQSIDFGLMGRLFITHSLLPSSETAYEA